MVKLGPRPVATVSVASLFEARVTCNQNRNSPCHTVTFFATSHHLPKLGQLVGPLLGQTRVRGLPPYFIPPPPHQPALPTGVCMLPLRW